MKNVLWYEINALLLFSFWREKGKQTTRTKEKPLSIKSLQSFKRSLNSSQFISWKSNLFSVKIDCSRVHKREKFSSQLLIVLKICMRDKPFLSLEQSEIDNCKTKKFDIFWLCVWSIWGSVVFQKKFFPLI